MELYKKKRTGKKQMISNEFRCHAKRKKTLCLIHYTQFNSYCAKFSKTKPFYFLLRLDEKVDLLEKFNFLRKWHSNFNKLFNWHYVEYSHLSSVTDRFPFLTRIVCMKLIVLLRSFVELLATFPKARHAREGKSWAKFLARQLAQPYPLVCGEFSVRNSSREAGRKISTCLIFFASRSKFLIVGRLRAVALLL